LQRGVLLRVEPSKHTFAQFGFTEFSREIVNSQARMSTPHKTLEGAWRVQIMVRGQRESATFPTRREAQVWVERRKTELRAVARGQVDQIKTLGDAIERYAREVSPAKRGWKWELKRLNAFLGSGHAPLPVALKLADVTPDDLGAWRDARLGQVRPGSVLREMTLLGSVLESARREWRWIAANPMRDVRRPSQPMHRERIISGAEARAMLRVLGHRRGPQPPGAAITGNQAVALCFLLALMTGMRAGELCAIGWPDVHEDFVRLRTSKTGVAYNKFGITNDLALKFAEYDVTAQRASQILDQKALGHPDSYDFDYLKAVHQYLFKDVYEWAGKPRTILFSKRLDSSTISEFAAPKDFEQKWRDLAGKTSAFVAAKRLPFKRKVDALVDIFVDASHIHPFPEGKPLKPALTRALRNRASSTSGFKPITRSSSRPRSRSMTRRALAVSGTSRPTPLSSR
jgi:fido (protein-threonine AMPylation protein)